MTRTVLVTGGAGFVGSHFVQRVMEITDWNVVSIDSFRGGGTFTNLISAADWNRERVVSLTHDLTVPLSTRQTEFLDSELGVDAIVNIASRCHVGESINEGGSFVTNNVQLMTTVLELAEDLQVDRLIHMSTDEVYGPRWPQSPQDYLPSSPYAASKAAQECLALAWRRTYDVPVTIVNSANMIGERQHVGAFLPLVVYSIIENRVINVHATNGVVGSRHYSYVGNVVDELLAELHRTVPSERIQLGGQETLSNTELIARVSTLLDREPRWRLVESSHDRPGYDLLYPQLDTQWRPTVTFAEALQRTVDSYVK